MYSSGRGGREVENEASKLYFSRVRFNLSQDIGKYAPFESLEYSRASQATHRLESEPWERRIPVLATSSLIA